ncbi:MAG TPA: glutaredoxin family protein [Steroidobacteraceae bacterium]|nr:glutaredoxin family protein [Steroidobacteraceae bacterium]
MSAARLTVVHRHDCQLCDEMLVELAALGRTLALPPIDVVDVDADPVLKRRHGLDVPVLLLDGTVVCRHRLDRGELLRLLQPGPHAPTRA